MAKRDYYEVLGVAKNATDDQIKTAYRKQAMKYHPDRNPDDKAAEDKFKEANEAYEVLSNEDKRNTYDQFGHDAMGAGGGGQNFSGAGFDDMFGDIFNMFGGGRSGGFSAGGRSNGPQKGGDMRVNLTLSFEDAVFGCSKTIKLNRKESCPDCDGSGAKAGTSKKTCPVCNGAGLVRVTQKSMFGMIQTVKPCDNCHGEGTIIETPCDTCSARGYVNKERTLNIKIPAGVDTGSVLPLRREGNAGSHGGPNGDVYIYITVLEHEYFEREDSDIFITIPITYSQASLGAQISVPTLEKKVKLTIPEGTQSAQTFKLKGKGVANPNGFGKGSEYITVQIETPSKLTSAQKKLLKEFETSFKEDNHPKFSTFWKKIK